MSNLPVIFIVGATATGKSSFAMECARKYGGEILNGDSVQMYESVNIGSAKPTAEELSEIPHHLIDSVPEGESHTAGQFRRNAQVVLHNAEIRNVPVVYIVGGSGFYLQALQKGLFEIPDVPAQIKASVRAESSADLFQELKEKDPEYANKIKPADSYRIARAIEVIRATGETFTSYREQFKPEKFPYRSLKIGLRLPKAELITRVGQRVESMLQQGLIEETESLLKKGLESWPALKSVGYKECVQFFKGELTRDELPDEIIKSTVQLAKRQSTWFKKDMDIKWVDPMLEVQMAFQLVEDFLRGKS